MREDTRDLLERFRAGDRAAYEVLVRRYDGSLASFVAARLDPRRSGPIAVDDIVQETQLEALRSLGRFEYRRPLAFFLWLCGIARHRMQEHARQGRRAPASVSLSESAPRDDDHADELVCFLEAGGADPAEQAEQAEAVQMLALALEEIGERRRSAIILRHAEGLDNDACARRLGTSPGAFRVLLCRATEDLRDALRRAGARRPGI